MRLYKFTVFISIALILLLTLSGCASSYPRLEITINEKDSIRQEFILCYELSSESENTGTIKKSVKSSLKKLVNEGKTTSIPEMFDEQGAKIELAFSKTPDELHLDEYHIITVDDKFYGTTDIYAHNEIEDDKNPYYVIIEREIGGLANPENPDVLLPIPRGMVITAKFGEEQIRYLFIIIPQRW